MKWGIYRLVSAAGMFAGIRGSRWSLGQSCMLHFPGGNTRLAGKEAQPFGGP